MHSSLISAGRSTPSAIGSHSSKARTSSKGDSAPPDSITLGQSPAALDLLLPSLSPPALLEPSAWSTSTSTSPHILHLQSLGQSVAWSAIPGLGAVAGASDRKEILGLFDRWNGALQTGDPDKAVQEYAPDAILLPTLSNKVRHNHAEIRDYFEHFLAKGPHGTIDEANVRMLGDVAVNSGVYTFGFADGSSVQARYTFVYRKTEGEWKIIEHHSSAMPEKRTAAA